MAPRHSFESVEFDVYEEYGSPKDQDDLWMHHGSHSHSHHRPGRPAIYGNAFGSGSGPHGNGNERSVGEGRDPDGFRLDASPVVPRGMLGEKI